MKTKILKHIEADLRNDLQNCKMLKIDVSPADWCGYYGDFTGVPAKLWTEEEFQKIFTSLLAKVKSEVEQYDFA